MHSWIDLVEYICENQRGCCRRGWFAFPIPSCLIHFVISRRCLGRRSLRSRGTSAPCFVLRLLIHDALRVKADSLFSYQPPINLVAVCILLPASYVLSPRWFHKVSGRHLPGVMPTDWSKVNVFLIRSFTFAISKPLSTYPDAELRISPSSSLSRGTNVSSATQTISCAPSYWHRSSKENCFSRILRNDLVRI